YRLLNVPRDTVLRQKLEAKSMEELAEILTSLRKPHNITDLYDRERAIRAIEIGGYQASRKKEADQFPRFNALSTGILCGREERRSRITRRLRGRFNAGLVNEVKGLLDAGVDAETLIYYGLEYKYITLYLQGELNYDEMFKSLETAIHQFAKRQMTWFRKMQREGIKIEWIDSSLPLEEKIDAVLRLLKRP
ncbi:MAG TPA: tRNA dimethylallyltransferase, partial [Bacteroidales bacterium]|nr:tRNA dimethylallyltransferase [Bacteroidales bacterium]